jgi:hypothetical protein
MNEIPDLDSKIRIATQIDFFEKRYWEMIKELHAKNDMLEEQTKKIEELKQIVESTIQQAFYEDDYHKLKAEYDLLKADLEVKKAREK